MQKALGQLKSIQEGHSSLEAEIDKVERELSNIPLKLPPLAPQSKEEIDLQENLTKAKEDEEEELKSHPKIEVNRNQSQSTCIFSTNLFLEKDQLISHVENNVQELCETMKQSPLSISECSILFQSIIDTILSLDCSKIYESNLGKHLKELSNTVDDRRPTGVQYEKVYQMVTQGIEKIRRKLMDGFFSCRIIKPVKVKPRFKKIQKIRPGFEKLEKVQTRENSLQEV